MKPENLFLYLFIFIFLFTLPAFADPKKGFREKPLKYKKGEILIKYRASSQANRGSYFKKRFNYSQIKSFRRSRIHHLKLPKNKTVPAAVEELLKDPNVEYAEPNYAYYATATPNDEHFSKLWGLHNTGQDIYDTPGTPDADIDAPEAWDIITNAEDVIVAVVDSGVDYNHPDLADNIWINTGEIPGNGIDDDGNGKIDDVRGWDFVDDDNDPMDLYGHGTHVAGTIGAVGNNGIGITGVAWNTKIMIVRGLNPRGWGWTSNLAEAIEYASENGADVINLSWGGGNQSDTLQEVIENSTALLVCAAGNDSEDTDIVPSYPSSYTDPNIISVAATDPDDNLAFFSNYGNTSVDVGAPGVEIYSTIPSRKTIFLDDFEDENTSGWSFGGTNNNWGATSSSHSIAPQSLSDTPTGNYSNNTDSWIQTPPLDLTSEDSISFIFDFKGTVLSGDSFPCEVSMNGSDWVEIDSGSFDFDYWYDAGYDVTPYQSTSTRFRFRLVSDGSGTEDGVYIDNVEVTAFDEHTYAYKSGTSMAAPHVAGIAALVKAMQPEFTALDIKDAIENNVDVLSSLSGQCVTGGRVNLNKLTSLYEMPAILPYFEDFSSGLPNSIDGWSYYSSNTYGQIQLVNERLRMDSSSSPYTLNEAILSIDLQGFNNVQLDFFQSEFNDGMGTLPNMFSGHYNGDGVSISSDGTTWYTIINASALDTGSAGQIFSIRLDDEVTRIQADYDPEFGYTSSFKIKFQQYDRYSYPSDGREWDNIEITGTRLFYLTTLNSTTEGDGTLFDQGQISLGVPAVDDTIIALTSSDASEVMVPATVTILTGQTSANFDITIIDDGILDGTQTVEIGASSLGYPLKTNVIQVHDNETAVLTLDIPANAAEGDGTIPEQGIVVVNQAVDENVVVALQSNDTSELTVPEYITIPAEQTSAVFDLSIIDDNVIDGIQTATVTASVTGWTSSSDAIDVEDNESLNLMVAIPESATEGDGILAGVGTISISGAFVSDVTVELSSDDITEVVVPASVVLPAGQTSVTFDLTIIDDAGIDASQTTVITASSPGWISGNQTITVQDNDPGVLQFSSPTYTANEGDGSLSIQVIRTVSSSGIITVDYTTSSGTALAGEDFTTTSGTLTFADGEIEKTFDVFILEDTVFEGSEDLNLTLSNPGGGAALVSPETAVVSISDNEIPSPPYSQDFSTGLPPNIGGWGYYSSSGYGRIQVINERLRMDSSSNGAYVLNEAILSINLQGFTAVQLDFFQAEFGDEQEALPDMFTDHYNGDGVAISSDGNTWYTIVNASALDTGTAGQTFSIDLDAEVARIQADYDPTFGYTSNFKIKFQQYDNYTYPSDGREWDDIAINGTPAFLELTIPNSAIEGEGTLVGQGEVNIGLPASEDTIINLTSGDLSEVIIPDTVTILTGQSSVTFDININDDDILDGTQTITIGASAPGYSLKTNIIQVHDNETATLTIDIPAIATEGDGTIADQGIVTASQTVDEDVAVAIQSNDTSEATVPEYVTIPAGLNSIAFNLNIIDDNVIDGSQNVIISASVQGWNTDSDTMVVADNDTYLAINVPSQILEGSGIIQDAGQVSIVSPLDYDLIINLLSDDTSEITVPQAIILSAGQISVSFDIAVIDDGILDGDKNVNIIASSSGWVSGTDSITVVEGALRISPEFKVSTYTESFQEDSSIAGLENGSFVATWTSNGQDGSASGIFGQIFDSSGVKIGEEFQVNSYTLDIQVSSSVARLENGGFVVTWMSYAQDGDRFGIYGQIFDSSGNKIGTEFQAHTDTTDSQNNPSVTGLDNDNFVVTWERVDQYGFSNGTFGQIFDSSGNKIGTEFWLNTYSSGNQTRSSVTGLGNGGFIATWASRGQDDSGYYGIFGQIFDSSGAKIGTEFQINTYTPLSQRNPSVAKLKNGGFIVTWASDGQDGSGYGIFGQVFDSSGTKTDTEFQVNTYTTDEQTSPSVAGLQNGWFVVTWVSDGQDGDDHGVYGQMFDSSGNNIGTEFRANIYTYADQTSPSVTGLENGNFVIAWQSHLQNGIYAQIFTVDTDMDFLTDNLEAAGCTDPLDADTDDDGIMDSDEDVNRNGIVDTGETDPCNQDSDDDGIQDGTELGYTLLDITSDTDTGVFRPDTDPSTLTDPLDPDSDNDGLDDGFEDIDGNGSQDAGETSPGNPDSDDDGMLDGYEVDNNLDPLFDDSFEDLDSDGYSNYRESLMGSAADDSMDIPAIIADFDLDLDVDAEDLMLFINEYGRTDCVTSDPCASDMDNDGDVDDIDMSFMAEDMGRP